ncbi:MAG TPA: threonine ammonia-lyase [Acidimicrobiia bacterium]
MVSPALAVTLEDVEAAADRLADHLEPTPTTTSPALDAATGTDVLVKLENLQRTGSFKERGACNRLLLLDDAARERGVIAMSAGNHGQALAFHAARLGVPCTVVMPEHAPFVKVARTTALGARVVQHGADLTATRRYADELAAAQHLTDVPPYDDPAVIAGQGSLALELRRDHPEIDALVVPVGGGGLVAGIAVAARGLAWDVEIVGVQAAECASMVAALRGGPFEPGDTVADGIAVREPGRLTLPIVRDLVDDVVTVTEASLEAAISTYLEVARVVAEGAGAAPLAAVMEHPDRFRGRRVGLVLSGGNVDTRLLASVIMRALARRGCLTRLTVEIPDVPGSLATVTAVVGRVGANIVEVTHRRDVPTVELKEARLELVVETRDRAHLDELRAALEGAGYPVTVEPVGLAAQTSSS